MHHYAVIYYFHLNGKWIAPPSAFYTLSGQVGIALFFMVTGFLFWYKIITSRDRIDWLKLYVSRIFRLLPLYCFVLTVVCIIVVCIGGAKLNVSVLSLIKSLLIWLSFLQMADINAFKDTSRIVASVIWTLKYEWLFYLSLPILAIIYSRSNKHKILLFIFIGCIIEISRLRLKIPYLDIDTRYFIFFLVGAISASIYTIAACRSIAKKHLASFIPLLSMLLLFVMFDNIYGKWQILLMAIFFSFVSLGNSIFGILSLPAVVLLGEISYSIYLLHGIVLYMCFSVVFPKFMSTTTPSIQLSLAMCLLGPFLVLFSWITFSTIESPFIRIGRHIARYLSQTFNKKINAQRAMHAWTANNGLHSDMQPRGRINDESRSL